MAKINRDKLMNIAIVILCIILLLCSIRFINNYRDSPLYYTRDSDYYLWYISDEMYSELPSKMYNSKNVDNPSEELRECLAVAKYYLNTSYYKMYKEVGNNTRAEEYLSRMEENKREIGDLSYTIAEINEELGIDFD